MQDSAPFARDALAVLPRKGDVRGFSAFGFFKAYGERRARSQSAARKIVEAFGRSVKHVPGNNRAVIADRLRPAAGTLNPKAHQNFPDAPDPQFQINRLMHRVVMRQNSVVQADAHIDAVGVVDRIKVKKLKPERADNFFRRLARIVFIRSPGGRVGPERSGVCRAPAVEGGAKLRDTLLRNVRPLGRRPRSFLPHVVHQILKPYIEIGVLSGDIIGTHIVYPC